MRRTVWPSTVGRSCAPAEIELWRVDYNCERPHSSLDYRTPKAFGDLVRSKVPPSAGAAAAILRSEQQHGVGASERTRGDDEVRLI